MELFFIHLLKSSSILLLFLLSYRLFLRKETFFSGNRFFLIVGPIIAICLPFITISKTILVAPNPMLQNDFSNIGEATNTPVDSIFNWFSILIVVYVLGILYFFIKLLTQFNIIKQIKRDGTIIKEDNFYHVKTRKPISPFSFFKHIFYYPNQFEETELITIIEHEKVHVRELHSLDILVTEILFILFWFNPIIWFYRICIKQNLEFLADAKTCALNQDKKDYQYLMLKQAIGNHKLSIANPFYNSIIKKRIVMLNQNQSKSINRLKLIIVLPFLAVFLFAFNTKEVYKTTPTSNKPLETYLVDKGFNVIITKNTTNEELNKIKEDFALKKIDFSYTSVRNRKNEIIDLQMHVSGKNTNNKIFKSSYDLESEHPIEELLISYDDINSRFYIGKKSMKQKLLKRNTLGGLSRSLRKSDNTSAGEKEKNNFKEIAYTITKNTPDKIFVNYTQYFKERGVAVDFKNIKRNNRGEIKSIKVNYDNGLGDKGTYQQKKTTAITPFIVTVNFIEDSPAEITVSAADITSSSNQPTNNGISKNKSKTQITTIQNDSIAGANYKTIIIGSDSTIINEQENVLINTDEAGDFNNFLSIDNIKLVSEGADKPLYIIDGEEVENLETINPDEIESMDILTEKAAMEKYGEKGKNGVVEVVTKAEPLYYIDGKKSNKKTATALNPDKIESMNILKGKAAQEKYGDNGENGVVEITTKKN